ncbi:MAG: TonB-dependent receptor [Rhodospirillaceae bacterium]|nr:TonB-dependent receptor [Rhodospirillaceae bacterium]
MNQQKFVRLGLGRFSVHKTVSLALVFLSSTSAFAQETSRNLGYVEEIIVTGTSLTAMSQPASTSVLSLPELERRDVYRISDALPLLPGVSFQPGNRGAGRNEASIYIRGFDLSRVPVLLDGIPIYVPYDGYIDLNRLQTFSLEAIEVARGYTSVLYGPNAMAGAVNLVTRRPEEGFHGRVVVRGEFADDLDARGYNATGIASFATSTWYAQGAVGRLDRDYTILPGGFTPTALQASGRRLRSAAEDLNLTGKIGYTPENGEYTLIVIRQEGEKGAPPYAGPTASNAIFFDWPFYDKTSVYLNTRTDFGNGWILKGRAYYDSFKNQLRRYDNVNYTTQFLPFAFTSNYDDNTYGGSTELTIPVGIASDVKIAGFLKQDTHREFNPTGGPSSRMRDLTGSIATAARFALNEAISLSAGASYDFRNAKFADNPSVIGTQFPVRDKNAFNVQAGVEYALNDDIDLYSGVSRKSRFASMFERYSYRLGFGQPNPALEPEQLTTVEAGVRGSFASWLSGSASIYWGEAADFVQNAIIGTNPVAPFNTITQSQNVGTIEIAGFETDLTAKYEWLSAHLRYTYLDRVLKNRPGVLLFGVPKNKIDFDIQAELGRGFFGQASLSYRGMQRTSDIGTGNPIQDYALVGLKAGWQSQSGYAIEVAATNLFDTYYEYDAGYPGEGRSVSLTLRYQF